MSWNLLIYKKARKIGTSFYFNQNLIILSTLENNEFRMVDNNLNLIFWVFSKKLNFQSIENIKGRIL